MLWNASRQSRTRLVAGLTSGAAAAALFAGAAHAQEAAPAPAGANQGGVGVVTVTAERRSENLQKVPISATVRTGKQLKDQNVYGVQQLQNQTPGVSIQPPVTGETYINIRGVGIQEISPNSSNGVAFYVDGVYIPSLIDTVDTFYDLNNVEVLRGPQGTLVGSNSDGGAIFVNSVQPSFDRVKGYVQQTIGDYSDYRTEGGINLPINDMVAARLAFVFETRDSFTKNIGAQSYAPFAATYPCCQNQPGNVDFDAARLQVAFKPTDNVQLTVRFEPYESRTDGYPLKPDESAVGPLWNYVEKEPTFTTLPATASPFYDPWTIAHPNSPFVIDSDTPTYFNIGGQRTSATLAWHLTPTIEFKDVVSYLSGYERDENDLDLTSAPAGIVLPRQAIYDSYSEEANLLSTGNGPFQWVVGFYYLNADNDLRLSTIRTDPALGHSSSLEVNARHETYAGFASGTYQFSPQWSLTVGGRISYDYMPFIENPNGTTPPLPTDGQYLATDTEPSWTAKLNFQVTPATLLYASVSTGYKAGGVNLQIPTIGITPANYDPETNMVEELGVKTDFLDHRLRLDADVFDSQYDHYQLSETYIHSNFTAPYTQTPGAANIWGAEAELTGVFGDFQFNLGVSYLNAKTAGAFTYVEPTTATITIPSGTTVPYSPQWMLSAGAQYSFHVWGGLLTPRIQYQFQDTQYVSILHIAQAYPLNLGTVIPAHGTADLLLTYAAPEHWQVQFYVTNFTNVTYISNATQSVQNGGPYELSYGPPLQYGVRLSYNF